MTWSRRDWFATALAMSIDRQLINEAVIGGVGWPVEIPYYDINHPDWEEDRWGVGYDPAMAETLLDQAGFPRGGDGNRFKIAMFAWPVGHFFGDIGDAVAQFWEEVGVDVDVLHYEYTVFRPTLVGRSATQAWTDTGPLENFATTPWDFPRGIQMSAIARGGKSHGIEIPEATQNYRAVSAEPDPRCSNRPEQGFRRLLASLDARFRRGSSSQPDRIQPELDRFMGYGARSTSGDQLPREDHPTLDWLHSKSLVG